MLARNLRKAWLPEVAMDKSIPLLLVGLLVGSLAAYGVTFASYDSALVGLRSEISRLRGKVVELQEASALKPSGLPAKEFFLTMASPGAFRFNASIPGPAISVKLGERVRITLANVGSADHDFTIDELNVRSSIVRPGETVVIEFVASRAGSFKYYCSLGTLEPIPHRVHRQTMEGAFIVRG